MIVVERMMGCGGAAKMIIQGILLTFLAIIAGLVSILIALVSWIVLKLFKKELHLEIKINSDGKSDY